MQIEKEFISLDPHSFETIEYYLACLKEIQLKLGKCGKGFTKNDGYLIKLVSMNLRTPYDVFFSSFCTNWQSHKLDDKDYSFDVVCDLLIRDKQKLIEEGNIVGKPQDHLMKGKGNKNYKDRSSTDGSSP